MARVTLLTILRYFSKLCVVFELSASIHAAVMVVLSNSEAVAGGRPEITLSSLVPFVLMSCQVDLPSVRQSAVSQYRGKRFALSDKVVVVDKSLTWSGLT